MNEHRNNSLGIIGELARAYPGRSVITVTCLLLSGLAEGIGVMTLLPLIDLAIGGEQAATTTVGRWTHDLFASVGATPTLGVMLILIVIGISLKGLFTLFAMKEVGYTVAHVMTDLRLQLIHALLLARWRYFVSQPVGALSNAISNEAERAAMVYRSGAMLIALLVQVLVYAGVVLVISWQVALAGIAAGVAASLLFRSLIEATRLAGARQTELLKSLSARLTDALQGIKPIKAMGHEKELLSLLESETHGLNDTQHQQVWDSEMMRVLQEPFLVIIIAAGLYVTITFGSYSFPSLMVLVFLFYRLLNRVHAIQQFYQAVVAGESAYLSIRNAIFKAKAEQETDDGSKLPASELSEIRIDRVRFAYGEKILLNDLCLTLGGGEFVAIGGPSGVGKTTVADLLARLIEPVAGTVLLNGIPLQEISLAAWRHQIGYVPQELLLFHDTIFKNISLGNSRVSHDDAMRALRDAGGWDFVAALPDGLNTIVGERGAKLSGGQRQRISLARALVRQPHLLILDEVTSALDPVTEEAICTTLKSLSGKVTILAVSHQPAVLRAAHKAYHLVGGQLVLASPSGDSHDAIAFAVNV